MYGDSFRCLKNMEKDSMIWGNYNTGNATAVLFMFEKCDSEKYAKDPSTNITCKSE